MKRNFNERQSLDDSLNELMKSELPEELKPGDRHWLLGVAKVRKCDGSTNYCVVCNDGHGRPRVMKDFGHTARIVGVEKIHPTHFLSEGAIPNFKKPSAISQLLSAHGEKSYAELASRKNPDGTQKTDEQVAADRKRISDMVLYYAIREEVEMYKEKKRLRAMTFMQEEENDEEEEYGEE